MTQSKFDFVFIGPSNGDWLFYAICCDTGEGRNVVKAVRISWYHPLSHTSSEIKIPDNDQANRALALSMKHYAVRTLSNCHLVCVRSSRAQINDAQHVQLVQRMAVDFLG